VYAQLKSETPATIDVEKTFIQRKRCFGRTFH